MTSHETTLPYEVEGALDPSWTELAFQALQAGDLIVHEDTHDGVISVLVTGPCPRCKGQLHYYKVLTAASLSGPAIGGQSADGSDALTLVVWCTCDGLHPERPAAQARGCGIAFHIEMAAA